MVLFKRLPLGLQIALPICLLIGGATLLAILHDNAHPDSDTVEKIGREAIPEQTGQTVDQIDCDKVVDITFARQVRCHVELADGTTYDTTASVRKRGGQNRSPGTISASFTLPPSADNSPRSGGGSPSTGILECVQAAGNDAAKLQACAANTP